MYWQFFLCVVFKPYIDEFSEIGVKEIMEAVKKQDSSVTFPLLSRVSSILTVVFC